MTLGEFVKQYREAHNMSIRSFADKVLMSPQQISNIEKGIGNNKKEMSSTMKTYQKIAEGIGMNEKEFLKMLNDDVLINPSDEKITATNSDGKSNYDREELKRIIDEFSDDEVHDLLLNLREKKHK